MIITKLMGGLGNQMFQLAAGKALALRNGTDCKVDAGFLNVDAKGIYTQRKFELSAFDSDIKIADQQEIDAIVKTSVLSRIFSGPKHYREKGHEVNAPFFSLKNGTYIEGYWQSEKYFKDHEADIRTLFKFKKELLNGTEDVLRQIQGSNSVSVHVRRGDYVTLSSANSFHGLCSPQYYKMALEQLNTIHKDLEVFIFSDDMDWCKANLSFGKQHFVETNSAYKDMHLMQHCKHNIIANSSFSWWAAWLNTNLAKVVIAPKKWFKDPSTHVNDIYPSSWIKLDE
jgi:hypothetical protein